MASASTVKSSPTLACLNQQQQNSNNRHSDNITTWSHITSCLLQNWIENDNQTERKLLIIDSRSAHEYNKLHIKDSINLVYSKIIKRRLLNDKISITELLIKNSIADFLIDNKYDCNIVVYDHESEHTNQLDSIESFAPILLSKLAQKFKSVSFLIGGLVNFNSKYPHLCERNSFNVYHSTSMDISPSSAACSSSEFSSPSIINEEMQFIKPKLNHSLSSCDASDSAFVPSNDLTSNNNKGNIFHFENALREPTKILDFLYLGSQEDSLSEISMKTLRITNVLNVSIQCPKPDFIEDAHFLRIPLNDGHAAKILPFFDIAFRFIEKCRKANTNVLIHCLAGISRSPTLAIAYLMKYKSLKSDEAYEYVKEKRPTISPNFNFLGQLYEYEKIQQNEAQKNKSETPADPVKPLFSHSSSTVTNSSLPFFKFTKKQHSAMNLLETTASSPSSFIIPTTTTTSPACTSNTTINTSSSSHAESLKYSPPKSQRKKQFIFQFNNNNTTETNVNENILSPQQAAPKPSLLLNQIVGQSFYNTSLPSPSQAFSNFNLNSPSSVMANKTIMNVFESNSLKSEYQSTGGGIAMPKSFTVNDINDLNGDKVVMRRPTNLFNDKFSNVNNLKRPSSILLEANNNIAANLNEIKPSEFGHFNFVKPTSACISPSVSIPANRNHLFYSAASSSNIITSIATNNSAATNSSSTASSSCSSSASSASSASSTLMASLMNNNLPTHTSSISSNINITNQQTSQKKMKLSPIQDRNILNNFTQNTTHESNSATSTSFSSSLTHFKSNSKKDDPFNNDESSLLKRNLDIEDQTLTPSSNSTVLFRSKLNFNLMLNPSTNTQEHYMYRSITSKMSESKSMDTIKSESDSPNRHQKSANSNLNRNNSFELIDDANALIHVRNNEDSLFISNSLGNHSSVSTATLSNNFTSSNSVHMHKSSSNSSSKNGSNKNSLHGSIETMIEVS